MSCFQYRGAIDVSKALQSNFNSSDIDNLPTSDDDDDDFLSKNKKSRKRKHKQTNQSKTKQKTKKPPVKRRRVNTLVQNPSTSNDKKESEVHALDLSDDLDEFSDDLDEFSDLNSSTNSEIPSSVMQQSEKFSSAITEISKSQMALRALKQRFLVETNFESPEKPQKKETCKLTIQCADDSHPTILTVSVYDSFSKILDIYCTSQSLRNTSETKIKFDDIPVGSAECPSDYAIKDGDKLIVHLNGFEDLHLDKSAGSTQPVVGNTVKLMLRSQSETKNFRLNQTDPFSKLFAKYCQYYHLPESSVIFTLDGDKLDLSSTPEDEDMEDGDIIDVIIKK